MRCGASLGSVAIWGRPEHIALPADRLLQITYPERGLALEFENESLAYIGFEFSADHPQRRLPVDNLHDEMQFFSATTELADIDGWPADSAPSRMKAKPSSSTDACNTCWD